MRAKDMTKIELQRDNSQIGLQVVDYRLLAGILPAVYRLFAVRDPYLNLYSDSMTFSIFAVQKTRMDGRTDKRTDPHQERRGRI